MGGDSANVLRHMRMGMRLDRAAVCLRLRAPRGGRGGRRPMPHFVAIMVVAVTHLKRGSSRHVAGTAFNRAQTTGGRNYMRLHWPAPTISLASAAWRRSPDLRQPWAGRTTRARRPAPSTERAPRRGAPPHRSTPRAPEAASCPPGREARRAQRFHAALVNASIASWPSAGNAVEEDAPALGLDRVQGAKI